MHIKAIKSDSVTENKKYYAMMFNIASYDMGQFIMLQRRRAEEILGRRRRDWNL